MNFNPPCSVGTYQKWLRDKEAEVNRLQEIIKEQDQIIFRLQIEADPNPERGLALARKLGLLPPG